VAWARGVCLARAELQWSARVFLEGRSVVMTF
jgi:hypothetical protein